MSPLGCFRIFGKVSSRWVYAGVAGSRKLERQVHRFMRSHWKILGTLLSRLMEMPIYSARRQSTRAIAVARRAQDTHAREPCRIREPLTVNQDQDPTEKVIPEHIFRPHNQSTGCNLASTLLIIIPDMAEEGAKINPDVLSAVVEGRLPGCDWEMDRTHWRISPAHCHYFSLND